MHVRPLIIQDIVVRPLIMHSGMHAIIIIMTLLYMQIRASNLFLRGCGTKPPP